MSNQQVKIIASGYCVYLRIGDTPESTYQMSFPNPVADPHIGWTLTYSDSFVKNAMLSAVSALETFDHLLSDKINMEEATRRLRLLRAARRELISDAADLPQHADQPL